VSKAIIGWEAEVRLHRGKGLAAAEAVSPSRIARIALAYGIPLANVVAEQLMTAEQDRFKLIVLDRNPLQAVQRFTGPSLDRATGRIQIGVHADNTPAYWQLWRPGWGACHGMIAGTTGAGKSSLLEILLTEARHSGLVVPWLGDPDNGSNQWKDSVDCYAGSVPRIRKMLQTAEAVMLDRVKRWTVQRGPDGSRRNTSQFTPTVAEPQILVVLDEAPEILLDDECVRIIGRFGKRGRKWGVGVVIVTQVPSLAELGNDLVVRSMLSSVNVVMFRTSDKLSAQMGALAKIDPHDLPEQWPDGTTTAGLALLGTSTRLAPFRGLYVAEGHSWATSGDPVGLPEADVRAACARSDYYATWRDLLDVPAEDDSTEDGYPPYVPPAVMLPAAGETKRAQILAYLTGHGQATTGVIAQELDVPLPTVSQTMRRLLEQGLVVQPRRGMWAVPRETDAELDETG
jgi:hypothetical protein